jgi:hypothetical protein
MDGQRAASRAGRKRFAIRVAFPYYFRVYQHHMFHLHAFVLAQGDDDVVVHRSEESARRSSSRGGKGGVQTPAE